MAATLVDRLHALTAYLRQTPYLLGHLGNALSAQAVHALKAFMSLMLAPPNLTVYVLCVQLHVLYH
jgi:hypothetical protein